MVPLGFDALIPSLYMHVQTASSTYDVRYRLPTSAVVKTSGPLHEGLPNRRNMNERITTILSGHPDEPSQTFGSQSLGIDAATDMSE